MVCVVLSRRGTIDLSFSKQSPDFTLVQLDNKSLEVVKQAKLLGLTFDNKLSWN